MKIQKDELLKKVQILAPYAKDNPRLENCDLLFFYNNRIWVTNGLILVSSKFETDEKTFSIPANELVKFLKKTKETEFDLKIDESSVSFVSKSINLDFGITDIENEVKRFSFEIGEFEQLNEDFFEALEICQKTANKDKDHISSSVVFDIDAATGGARIAATCCDVDIKSSFCIHPIVSEFIIKNYPIEYCVLPENVVVMNGEDYQIKFKSHDISNFDGWRRFFEDFEGNDIEFPKDFDKVIDECVIFKDDDNAINIKIFENEAVIIGNKGAKGRIKKNIEFDGFNENIEFFVDSDLFYDSLKLTKKAKINDHGIMFIGEKFKRIVKIKSV